MLLSSTFYILGRNREQHAAGIKELKATSPHKKFVFVGAQVSLISNIDTVYKQIFASEKKVDVKVRRAIVPESRRREGQDWISGAQRPRKECAESLRHAEPALGIRWALAKGKQYANAAIYKRALKSERAGRERGQVQLQ
jgi:hypothetical protein